MNRQAVLVVSFGTSYTETREKTIDRIEADLAAAFPEHRIYRAWTSQKIIKKLLERDGTRIFTVKEAMKQMWEDGIREVLVQPTHVIDGLENDRMKEDIQGCAAGFERIVFGEPLLTARGDHREIFPAVMSEFSQLRKEEALVFMGHGTAHEINAVYEELDAEFKKLGYTNVFLGTVEASPTLEELLVKVEKLKPKKIFLAPFMLVAGAHALEDMSGEAEDSWKNRFQRAGYPVECVLKGLGEYEKIRSIYVRHAKNAGR